MQMGRAKERMAHLRGVLEPLLATRKRFSRTVPVAAEINACLPNAGLPLGCIHEVKGMPLASGIAFASILASRIPASAGRIVFIAPDQTLHPLGLLPMGMEIERLVHVCAKRPADIAWAALEALRCHQVGAVLAVTQSADLTLCRRFQLAAEKSGATGFLLTDAAAKAGAPIASAISRWKVTAIPSPSRAVFHEPCWEIDLVYCRSGSPASWRMAWKQDQLELLSPRTIPQPNGLPVRLTGHPQFLTG